MNTLEATITDVTSSQYLSSIRVAVGDEPFHLLLAESSNKEELIHTHVTLAFKETEVILSKDTSPTTANVQRAMVQKIERGIVLSQITLLYHKATITALVPTLTFELLGITNGDDVSWMVQPSEISLLRGQRGI